MMIAKSPLTKPSMFYLKEKQLQSISFNLKATFFEIDGAFLATWLNLSRNID